MDSQDRPRTKEEAEANRRLRLCRKPLSMLLSDLSIRLKAFREALCVAVVEFVLGKEEK